MNVSTEQLNELARILGEVGPKARNAYTLKAAVERLAPAIRALQAKGYTLADIGALLREAGLAIGIATLRQYMAAAKAGRRPAAGRATSQRSPSRGAEGGVSVNPSMHTPKEQRAARGDAEPAAQAMKPRTGFVDPSVNGGVSGGFTPRGDSHDL